MEKMRTRFLPKMTHDEVCEYVKRNDIIYVPFGTVEVHGTFPLDVETTTPEAFALLMAEETDGLVLGNLPYFFCGASPISPGTIQMSVEQGLAYLKAIAHSLLNQGFRRQVYLSLHGPAFLTGGVLAACARAAWRLGQAGEYGCKTLLDIPPALLLPFERGEEGYWKLI